MTNPVQAAIERAKQASAANAATNPPPANAVIETQQVPATQGQGGAVASYAPAQMATLDTLVNTGMSVDAWLKCTGDGFKIGDKPGIVVSAIKVGLALSDITVFHGVRYGNPATYKRSYDNVTCVQGGSWTEAINMARAADPKCTGAYVGADVKMVALEDIKDASGNLLVEAGKTLGHTTSVTGGKPVADFVREARARGLTKEVLEISLKNVQRTKPGVNPWGVLGFEIVGVYEPIADEPQQ